jgi:hypothetical protein
VFMGLTEASGRSPGATIRARIAVCNHERTFFVNAPYGERRA